MYNHPRRSRELFLHTPMPSTRKTSCKFYYVSSSKSGARISLRKKKILERASSRQSCHLHGGCGRNFPSRAALQPPLPKKGSPQISAAQLTCRSSRKQTSLAEHGQFSHPQHLKLWLLHQVFLFEKRSLMGAETKTVAGAPAPAHARSPGRRRDPGVGRRDPPARAEGPDAGGPSPAPTPSRCSSAPTGTAPSASRPRSGGFTTAFASSTISKGRWIVLTSKVRRTESKHEKDAF